MMLKKEIKNITFENNAPFRYVNKRLITHL